MTSIKDLYDMQEKLDAYIILKNNPDITLKELLTDTLLALQVEVSELANATRSFKHWSRKGPENKEILLEEYADILHFFLSLGLQLGFSPEETVQAYKKKNEENYKRQKEGY